MKRKLLIIMLFTLLFLSGCSAKKEKEETTKKNDKPKEPEIVYFVDTKTDKRPYGVMINNHNKARPNHAGLQEAYLMYELIVEGGITRYLALFQDKDVDKIGSIRSSRHDFLDYATENDAIYSHIGWSPQARSDMKKMNISNINGLYNNFYFRDKNLNVAYEHTAFTTMDKLKEYTKKMKYRETTDKKLLLNYSKKEFDIKDYEGAIKADNISIRYSYLTKTSYTYDPENKVYKHFVNDKAHTDGITNKQYTFKNIITYRVANKSIDSYNRQDILNIGKGEGYYITNGYAVPITWEKNSRSEKTIYKLKDGSKLVVNDGNTFIHLQPSSQNLEIKGLDN